MKKTIKAEIIADSLAPNGKRLTTFVLTFPRIVLAEFNTHRAISKNSASSRAIPFEKMRSMVLEDPFIPKKWMLNHKGMQGTEFMNDPDHVKSLNKDWIYARDRAVAAATDLYEKGLTKQLCNRLLEPFMWHTVIATATDWENFFKLRAHEAAEIHIQELAYRMLEEYNKSEPKVLKTGEWHIPFGDRMDDKELSAILDPSKTNLHSERDLIGLKIKVATARCARVSYMNFDGEINYQKDIKMHDDLSSSGHWSPFEHCAVALTSFDKGHIGNLAGFRQYRKFFQDENQTDSRVDLKVRD